jgi:CheY-like chemotaxis protein
MEHEILPSPIRSVAYGRRALIVDDVAMDGFIASRMLSQHGYEVTQAGDGTMAIEAVEKMDFDVVLMDIRMPGMDGLEATRRIRQLDGPHGKVLIVALTAMDLTEHEECFFEAGMDAFIPKPFDPDTLRAALARVNRAGPASAIKRDIPAADDSAIHRRTPGGRRTPIVLSSKDCAPSRPEWANFTMEKVFWTGMQYICAAEGITSSEFINEARRRHPEFHLVAAVRTQVVSYLRMVSNGC